MALIVEDGTGVANANTYVDIAYVQEYAASRGLQLPTDDAEIETLLMQAMDYLEALGDAYQGQKVSPDNPLQWPRYGVLLDGYELASDKIPNAIKRAQAQLAIDAQTMDLMPNSTGREVIAEQVDVIRVQYAETGNSNPQPVLTKSVAFLRPLMRQTSGLKSVRV